MLVTSKSAIFGRLPRVRPDSSVVKTRIRSDKQKTPALCRGSRLMPPKLLDLGFLVDHVLAQRDRVVLFHFKLVGHGPLVLVRGVKTPVPAVEFILIFRA